MSFGADPLPTNVTGLTCEHFAIGEITIPNIGRCPNLNARPKLGNLLIRSC